MFEIGRGFIMIVLLMPPFLAHSGLARLLVHFDGVLLYTDGIRTVNKQACYMGPSLGCDARNGNAMHRRP